VQHNDANFGIGTLAADGVRRRQGALAQPQTATGTTARYRKLEQRIRMGTISIVIETYTWLLGVIQFPDSH
jgi:hypothetical protein